MFSLLYFEAQNDRYAKICLKTFEAFFDLKFYHYINHFSRCFFHEQPTVQFWGDSILLKYLGNQSSYLCLKEPFFWDEEKLILAKFNGGILKKWIKNLKSNSPLIDTFKQSNYIFWDVKINCQQLLFLHILSYTTLLRVYRVLYMRSGLFQTKKKVPSLVIFFYQKNIIWQCTYRCT